MNNYILMSCARFIPVQLLLAKTSCHSDSVVLLNGVNVKSFEFDDRFHMPLECVKLPQPANSNKHSKN